MEEDIGDTSDLFDDHNVGDLSEGVVRVLVHLSPTVSSIPKLEEITAKITDLAEMITAVDKDHQKAGQYLLSKLTSHPPVAPIAAAMGPGGAGQLNLLMLIVNDARDQDGTLGQLLKRLEMATEENSRLKMQVESLSAEISSQGGIVLDGLGFTSEAQVRDFVLQECPEGDAFKVFLDVVSLFCCDPVYKPAPGWEKQTCAMDDGYSTTTRKAITLYYKPHCAWYTGGKKVILGKLLGVLKTLDGWIGVSGMDGSCQEIETSAATSAEIGWQWVADKLPSNRKLAPLALKMIDCLVEWIHTIHKHLDVEFIWLTQQHIADKEALILLSEEVIIMYTRIFVIQHQRMEFVANQANKIEYMVHCVWITCQVHWVMQGFIQGGLRENPANCSAFVRFLTKQMGGNVASGVGGQHKTLAETAATLKGSVCMAMGAAKEATQAAKEATTHASTANTTTNAAKNAVNTIYSKNSTLKC